MGRRKKGGGVTRETPIKWGVTLKIRLGRWGKKKDILPASKDLNNKAKRVGKLKGANQKKKEELGETGNNYCQGIPSSSTHILNEGSEATRVDQNKAGELVRLDSSNPERNDRFLVRYQTRERARKRLDTGGDAQRVVLITVEI